MKKKIVIAGISIVLLLSLFRLINPDIPKKVKVLDCEATYEMSVFGREYEGFNQHNAEMDVAKCLCEKYIQTKNKKYENEVRRIMRKHELIQFDANLPIDSICNNREQIFSWWYYE